MTYSQTACLLTQYSAPPKSEYRLMTTIPSEEHCNAIASPMRSLIKNSSGFSLSLPSALLHYHRIIGMTNLFERNIQNHVATFANRFHASDILADIYRIHLENLKDILWIDISPLFIDDFSVWK